MKDLSSDKITEMLFIDVENGIAHWKPRPVNQFSSERAAKSWNSKYAGTKAGYKGIQGYVRIRINGVRYFLHRLVWIVANGDIPDDLKIDHINHIRDDNRASNLRVVTTQENNRNISLPKRTQGPMVGVTRNKNKKTESWTAQIKVDGKEIRLGTSRSIEEAMKLRKSANRLFGFHENHGMGSK